MSYEDAYKIIVSGARRCFNINTIGMNLIVQSDLYPGSKTGEVSVVMLTTFDQTAEIVWDIKATGDATSAVTSRYRKKSSASIDRAMQAWLKGDVTTCSVAT